MQLDLDKGVVSSMITNRCEISNGFSPKPKGFQHAVYDEIAFSYTMSGSAKDWPTGHQNVPHYHQCGQVVYASSGTLNVVTDHGLWMVPPQRAVWIPPEQVHLVQAKTNALFRSIYINDELSTDLYTECKVIKVSPLLRECILELVRISPIVSGLPKARSLCELLCHEMSAASVAANGFHLPIPNDHRVEPIKNAVLAEPTDARNREDWANIVGASGRTIDRIFIRETGVSFGAWKRQVLLLEALRQLSQNKSVTEVALGLGYKSVSAFNGMFKAMMGVTPRQFYREQTCQ